MNGFWFHHTGRKDHGKVQWKRFLRRKDRSTILLAIYVQAISVRMEH